MSVYSPLEIIASTLVYSEISSGLKLEGSEVSPLPLIQSVRLKGTDPWAQKRQ